MVSTTIQGATATVLRNGRAQVKSIKVEQWTFDAPVLYLQLFNTNNPTVGTTAPVMVIPIPAGSTILQGPQVKAEFQSEYGGLPFATGLSLAVTTTHDGATGPDAGDEPRVTVHYEIQG